MSKATKNNPVDKKTVVAFQLKDTLLCAHTYEKSLTLAQLWQEKRISEIPSRDTVSALGGEYAHVTVKQIQALAEIPGVAVYVVCGSQEYVTDWAALPSKKVSVKFVAAESGLPITGKNTVGWNQLSEEDCRQYKSHKLGDAALLEYINDKEGGSIDQLHYFGKTGVHAAAKLGACVYPIDSPTELSQSLNALLKKLGEDEVPISRECFRPFNRSYPGRSSLLTSMQPLFGEAKRQGMTTYGTGRTY